MTVAGMLALGACNTAPKADAAKTEDQKEVTAVAGIPYKLADKQVVNFIGTKPVGEHHGTFNITEGTIWVDNDVVIKGGKIGLDITSLKILDKDTSGTSKLAAHLASSDFFDAANHPTANFELTAATPYTPDSTQKLILEDATHTISGNLTLKGITKHISFPAIVSQTAEALGVKANFNINRTDWGLVYGNDESLGDKFIRPEVNISFNIVAQK